MIDTQELLTARMIVARFGELDRHRWWATDGILGEDGAFVGPRVLPRTHIAGRMRIAIAVAKTACDERYPSPTATHLFRLEPETEDRFDTFVLQHLTDESVWGPIQEALRRLAPDEPLGEALMAGGLLTASTLEELSSLRLGPGDRSIDVSGLSDDELPRLAGGFIRGAPGALVVPFLAAENN